MTEATWGADPLERWGGFRALEYDTKASYCSSLASDGRVSWSCRPSETRSSDSSFVEVALTIDFPNIDWAFLQSVYGWAALQYQAWARGSFYINATACQSVLLYTDNLLEFWVDEAHYFGGDFYGYRKAPLVLHLTPGRHNLDIRLIRDVRAMGGVGEPKISVKLRVERTEGGLAITPHELLLSDVVNGRLAGELASVPVRNDSRDLIEIVNVTSPCVRLLRTQSSSLH